MVMKMTIDVVVEIKHTILICCVSLYLFALFSCISKKTV